MGLALILDLNKHGVPAAWSLNTCISSLNVFRSQKGLRSFNTRWEDVKMKPRWEDAYDPFVSGLWRSFQ